jgi:hypothetical protein
VGAAPGDFSTPQFWIEKDRLLLVRTVRKSASGYLVDVELGGYEPLGGGWVATEFMFKRGGQPYISEKYLRYSLPDSTDPQVFDVKNLKERP